MSNDTTPAQGNSRGNERRPCRKLYVPSCSLQRGGGLCWRSLASLWRAHGREGQSPGGSWRRSTRSGCMRHVDVPEEIGRALERESGKKKHIPVVAIVNGKSARVTLVPAGGGRYRLHLNTALRKAARADAGEVVSVELRLDRGSRSLPVPPDLGVGLKRHPKAWRAFQDLAPGHRRHFIQVVRFGGISCGARAAARTRRGRASRTRAAAAACALDKTQIALARCLTTATHPATIAPVFRRCLMRVKLFTSRPLVAAIALCAPLLSWRGPNRCGRRGRHHVPRDRGSCGRAPCGGGRTLSI